MWYRNREECSLSKDRQVASAIPSLQFLTIRCFHSSLCMIDNLDQPIFISFVKFVFSFINFNFFHLHIFSCVFFLCFFFALLLISQFSMRSRTPSLNGSMYSPYPTRKVSSERFLFCFSIYLGFCALFLLFGWYLFYFAAEVVLMEIETNVICNALYS